MINGISSYGKGFLFSIFTAVFLLHGSLAQQLESPVACEEGAEPLLLVYGDHTTGCSVSPAVDLDRFEFCGLANDKVRINVLAPDFMDPDVEVLDTMANPIAQQSCNNGCSMSIDFTLPADDCYFIFVSDVANNEIGDYMLQLERIDPASPQAVPILFDEAQDDTINPATDIDYFTFNGTAGTDIRLNVLAPDFMDPTVEIRDPTGAIVINGAADGAFCGNGCSFSVNYSPTLSGTYSLIIYDNAVNEAGNYQLSLWCMFGPCDSTGGGVPDPKGPLIFYDTSTAGEIEPPVDVDSYTFNATLGTDLRLNVFAPDFMDPTVEIRDPTGTVVINGFDDGAFCGNGCSFSVDLSPAVSGIYTLEIYDNAVNENGVYEMGLWCLFGPCDSNADGVPDPKGPLISYVTSTDGDIEAPVDVDSYTFNATLGTDLRLNVYAPDFMDPTVEIRDPMGAVVINGFVDGAFCGNGCSFSVDLSPAVSGTYTLEIYDNAVNETGFYEIGLWCLFGPCDSDADGLLDGNYEVSVDTPAVLQYGLASNDEINPAVDSDIFIFGGTAGDLIQINVLGPDFMDPTVEIRDPTGAVVINGVADGAFCGNGCSFSFNFSPAITGTYTFMIYDSAVNESGFYEIGLQCLIGQCNNAVAICSDNCIDVPNSLLMPDLGGNSQRDTDMDGYGNVCDADINNDWIINFGDLAIWSDSFQTSDPDADFDGNGIVNFGDLFIFSNLFLLPPGPACNAPLVP